MNKPKLIVVVGPTAVGKTAAAIAIAQKLNTVIVSADSRQCYKEMNIGVARPSEEELAAVPHFCIADQTIHQPIDAAAFEQLALTHLANAFQQHQQVVMVGGTGLYIQAVLQGMDEMPNIPIEVRQQVRNTYEKYGLPYLQQQLKALDDRFAREGEMENPHRCMRALEVYLTTGKSIKTFQRNASKERPFDAVILGLELPREQLIERIHQRVDLMIHNGLVKEALSLHHYSSLAALQTVGYQELFDYFDGKVSLTEAIDQIKAHTRQYAKRQMTWFKRQLSAEWFSPFDRNAQLQWLEAQLNKKPA